MIGETDRKPNLSYEAFFFLFVWKDINESQIILESIYFLDFSIDISCILSVNAFSKHGVQN